MTVENFEIYPFRVLWRWVAGLIWVLQQRFMWFQGRSEIWLPGPKFFDSLLICEAYFHVFKLGFNKDKFSVQEIFSYPHPHWHPWRWKWRKCLEHCSSQSTLSLDPHPNLIPVQACAGQSKHHRTHHHTCGSGGSSLKPHDIFYSAGDTNIIHLLYFINDRSKPRPRSVEVTKFLHHQYLYTIHIISMVAPSILWLLGEVPVIIHWSYHLSHETLNRVRWVTVYKKKVCLWRCNLQCRDG